MGTSRNAVPRPPARPSEAAGTTPERRGHGPHGWSHDWQQGGPMLVAGDIAVRWLRPHQAVAARGAVAAGLHRWSYTARGELDRGTRRARRSDPLPGVTARRAVEHSTKSGAGCAPPTWRRRAPPPGCPVGRAGDRGRPSLLSSDSTLRGGAHQPSTHPTTWWSSTRLPDGSVRNAWRLDPTGVGSLTSTARSRSSATVPSRSSTSKAKC